MILALLIASLADWMTFVMVVRRYGVGGELNPVAAWAYQTADVWGVLALKFVTIGLAILLLSPLPASLRAVFFGAAIVMALLGAATNTLAGSL